MTTTLDLSALQDLANNDPAKVRKFALLFIKSLEDVLGQIDRAMAENDLNLLGSMGHRAKSTALNIGAAEFSEQCRLLEHSARAQDAQTAMAIARGLRPRFETIQAALLQLLEPTAGG